MGRPEGKRPLGRPRRRCVNNSKMGLGSGQGAVEGSGEHGNEPLGSIKYWEVLEWLRNWRLLKKALAL
jgi:hypothetical protein